MVRVIITHDTDPGLYIYIYIYIVSLKPQYARSLSIGS